MLPELESSIWRDAIVFHNTRVRRKGEIHDGIVLSPKVENDSLLIWWGVADNRVYIDWVPVSELEEVDVKEITCVPNPLEVASVDLEASALEGQGDMSSE